MQNAQQQTLFGLYFDYRRIKQLLELLACIKTVLHYLLVPEDTTEAGFERQSCITEQQVHNILASIKTLLWFSVAIAIPLLIGQI